METLPKEIVNHIFDYTLSCKKDNNYFINKFITDILVEKHKTANHFYVLENIYVLNVIIYH